MKNTEWKTIQSKQHTYQQRIKLFFAMFAFTRQIWNCKSFSCEQVIKKSNGHFFRSLTSSVNLLQSAVTKKEEKKTWNSEKIKNNEIENKTPSYIFLKSRQTTYMLQNGFNSKNMYD